MDDKQDFTEGSIFKKMIHFMFPILGALILQAMYGAVDMLIVGRFGTAAAPAATVFGIALCFIYYKKMQTDTHPSL